jgi:hypothetical protein
MMVNPITSNAIREATRSALSDVLPRGSIVVLTAIGRRDDTRIAAQAAMRYRDADNDLHTVWVTATLDGMVVEHIVWANTEAQADIDFMRTALD